MRVSAVQGSQVYSSKASNHSQQVSSIPINLQDSFEKQSFKGRIIVSNFQARNMEESYMKACIDEVIKKGLIDNILNDKNHWLNKYKTYIVDIVNHKHSQLDYESPQARDGFVALCHFENPIEDAPQIISDLKSIITKIKTTDDVLYGNFDLCAKGNKEKIIKKFDSSISKLEAGDKNVIRQLQTPTPAEEYHPFRDTFWSRNFYPFKAVKSNLNFFKFSEGIPDTTFYSRILNLDTNLYHDLLDYSSLFELLRK